MITRCFEPAAGVSLHPMVPQSNASSRTSLCVTKLLIALSSVVDWYGLEAAHVLGHRDLGRQTLHRARAEEPDDALRVGEHVSRVVGLRDRSSVAEDEDVRVDALRRVVHRLDETHGLLERLPGLRPDRA